MRAREAEAVSARPAYHYRLPDCRLDDPEWSLAWEWNKWALVEEVSEDHDVLRELEAKWRAHRVTWPATRAMWARSVDPVLRSAFQHLGSAP